MCLILILYIIEHVVGVVASISRPYIGVVIFELSLLLITISILLPERNVLHGDLNSPTLWSTRSHSFVLFHHNNVLATQPGMTNISDQIREAILRWLGHVERNTEEDVVMRICKMDMEVYRNIGILKLQWKMLHKTSRKRQKYRENIHMTEVHGECKLDAPRRIRRADTDTICMKGCSKYSD